MVAPANDNVANAQVLAPGTTQVTGDSTNATQELPEVKYADNLAASGTTGLHTVWFRWLAPSSGTAQFDTIGSTYDTVLAIFSKNGGVTNVTSFSDLTVLASNDDASPPQSIVSYSVTAGVEYWLQLTGWGPSNAGVYTLNYPLPAATYPTPYVTGAPQGFSFTTSGTTVTYIGGGIADASTYDVLFVNSDNTVTTPSGWTLFIQRVNNQGSYIYYKNGGSTTATIALGGGISTNTDALWVRITNASGPDFSSYGSTNADGSPGSATPSFATGTYSAATNLGFAFAALHAFTGSTPTGGAWDSSFVEQTNATIGTSATATYGSVGVKVPVGTTAESPTYSWTNAVSDRYILAMAWEVSAPPTGTSAPAGQAAVAVTAFDASSASSAPAGQAAVAVTAFDATVTTVSGTSAPAGQAAVAVTAFDAAVSIGAAGAMLNLDPSTPGTLSANAQTLQTASFTPPAGSVLYAIAMHAVTSATANRTATITDTVGLTWSLVASSPLGPAPAPAGGYVAVYSAPVVTSAAMRVTSTITSNGLNGAFLKVFVYNGVDQATPADFAVVGHSATTVSQLISVTMPGTTPYLANIDSSGGAVPTALAGTVTFTSAKPNVDQMWLARSAPAALTPGTLTMGSSAPTTAVNDWVVFGVRPSAATSVTVGVSAFDATVSTSAAGSASAEATAVTVSALDAVAATGAQAQATAVSVLAFDAGTATGTSAQAAAVTADALAPTAANGVSALDAAVAAAGYDAGVSTSSSVNAAAVDAAVPVTAFDATVSASGSASAPADYAPVTTAALSPYVDAATLSDIANATATAYLAAVAVAINPAAEATAVTSTAFDAVTTLASQPAAEATAVTAAAFDAGTATATSTAAAAALASVAAFGFDASVSIGQPAGVALVDVAAQQPPPPGVTSSPSRVLTTSSRQNAITTVSDARYRTITTQ